MTAKITPRTYGVAHAAAWDAGNRSMRAAGRDCWNQDDLAAAIAEFERLMGEANETAPPAEPERCGYKWTGSYDLRCVCTLPKGHPEPNHHSGEVIDKEAFWKATEAKYGPEKAGEWRKRWQANRRQTTGRTAKEEK